MNEELEQVKSVLTGVKKRLEKSGVEDVVSRSVRDWLERYLDKLGQGKKQQHDKVDEERFWVRDLHDPAINGPRARYPWVASWLRSC